MKTMQGRFLREQNITVTTTATLLGALINTGAGATDWTTGLWGNTARLTLQNLSVSADAYWGTKAAMTADATVNGGAVMEPRDVWSFEWPFGALSGIYLRVASGTAVVKVFAEQVG